MPEPQIRIAVLTTSLVASLGTAVTLAAPAAAGACAQNSTSTSLALGDSLVRFGNRPVAEVSVTSNAGTPDGGFVQFFADGDPFASPQVEAGHASANLPVLAVGDYPVAAVYDGACDWQGSSSDSHTYTVRKARVVVDPRVRNAALAKFRAGFEGSGGVDPGVAPFQDGVEARFKVVKRATGSVVRSEKTAVVDGLAKVDLADLRSGRYRLEVTFLGTDNFKSAAAETTFRVQ